MATIGYIQAIQYPPPSTTTYDISFYGDSIRTTVTDDPDVVSRWISDIDSLYSSRSRSGALIVGLDAEWRPSFSPYPNPVATIQLCVGRRSLIYQILNTRYIPASLVRFLSVGGYAFVGVGVQKDLEKLQGDYGIGGTAYAVDLDKLAAEVYDWPNLKNSGLKYLSRIVLQKELVKPENVTMSRWDEPQLTHEQVKYACLDAFASFEIGRTLNAFF